MVATDTYANHLLRDDANYHPDVITRSLLTNELDCITCLPSGAHLGLLVGPASLSADGRWVAFSSPSAGFARGDSNGRYDIFINDRTTGSNEWITRGLNGTQSDGNSEVGGLSRDGRYVVFSSDADNLVEGDTNGTLDVFLRDRMLGVTERESISSGGVEGDGDCASPSVSDDGRYVAFCSVATNLDRAGWTGTWQVFIHNRR